MLQTNINPLTTDTNYANVVTVKHLHYEVCSFCAAPSALCQSCIVPISCNMSVPINSQVILSVYQLNMANRSVSNLAQGVN